MVPSGSVLPRRLLAAVLGLVMLLAGCRSREDALLGKWALPPGNGGEFALEFFKGGTVVMTLDDRNYSGTYDLPQDDQILLVMSGDLGLQETLLTDVELEGDILAFNLNGEDRIELERIQR